MTVCFGPGYKEQVLDQYEVNEISDLLLKYPNLSAVQNIIDQGTYQRYKKISSWQKGIENMI